MFRAYFLHSARIYLLRWVPHHASANTSRAAPSAGFDHKLNGPPVPHAADLKLYQYLVVGLKEVTQMPGRPRGVDNGV